MSNLSNTLKSKCGWSEQSH